MNPLSMLLLFAGVALAGVVFSVLRFPGARRPQFRALGGVPLLPSLFAALLVFLLFAALA